MKAMLHGYRRVDMTDDAGRQVQGYSCFVGYPANGVEGEEVTKVFVSDSMARGSSYVPSVGQSVSLEFTPRGRLAGISAVREK